MTANSVELDGGKNTGSDDSEKPPNNDNYSDTSVDSVDQIKACSPDNLAGGVSIFANVV